MSAMASQITSLTIVYSIVYSRRRSKKTSKPRVTVLCAGNSPVTDEFPTQRASNAENVSIWWRHRAQGTHAIDQSYNSTMHPTDVTQFTSLQQKCAHVHITVTKWCIVGYGTGALWDLSIRSTINTECWRIMYSSISMESNFLSTDYCWALSFDGITIQAKTISRGLWYALITTWVDIIIKTDQAILPRKSVSTPWTDHHRGTIKVHKH